MKIGFVQFPPLFGEVEKNLRTVAEALACFQGPGLIVLPELFTTGYQFVSRREVEDLAEPVPGGAATQCMLELAAKHDVILAGGIAEKGEDGKIYNSAVLAGPEGFAGRYRKIHLFMEEKDFFAPGNEGFAVFQTGGIRVGLMICFDWIFPESARRLALEGAQAIAHPANLVLPFCQKAMITRSLENRVFTVTANRTGWEERGGKKRYTFTGMSQVTSPAGEVLLSAEKESRGLFFAEADLASARDKSITPRNDLFLDRRPELY